MMFIDINLNIEEGIPFDGTICLETYTLPTDIYVKGTTADGDVALRCCGPNSSCIIDSGANYHKRPICFLAFDFS